MNSPLWAVAYRLAVLVLLGSISAAAWRMAFAVRHNVVMTFAAQPVDVRIHE